MSAPVPARSPAIAAPAAAASSAWGEATPSPQQVLAYVQAAAALAGLPLDEARASAVAQHLARTLAIARVLDGVPLAPEHELAEIYRPAPFPGEGA